MFLCLSPPQFSANFLDFHIIFYKVYIIFAAAYIHRIRIRVRDEIHMQDITEKTTLKTKRKKKEEICRKL